MTVLLGLELTGEQVILTVVSRRGRLKASLSEPIDGPAIAWWQAHPDERLRAMLSLMERATHEGVLQAGGVAGIGITCDPGLVFLDREMKPIPARQMKWDEVLPDPAERTPARALRALAEARPRDVRRLGMVLSTLDYLRFKLTGALASSASFAWSTGLVSADSGVDHWRRDLIEELGYPQDAFPPIFSAECRVGGVSLEVIERTGIPSGVWVHAGSDPVASYLSLAREPKVNEHVVLLKDGRASLWRCGELPVEWHGDVAILSTSKLCYERVEDREWNGQFPDYWASTEPGERAIELRSPIDLGSWPEQPPGLWTMTAGAGEASCTAAIVAGLGLGYWQDERPLWRKARRSTPYGQWRGEQLAALEALASFGKEDELGEEMEE